MTCTTAEDCYDSRRFVDKLICPRSPLVRVGSARCERLFSTHDGDADDSHGHDVALGISVCESWGWPECDLFVRGPCPGGAA